jgi:hypothetical protein
MFMIVLKEEAVSSDNHISTPPHINHGCAVGSTAVRRGDNG